MPARKKLWIAIVVFLFLLVSCDKDAFVHLENAHKFYALGMYDQAIIELKTTNRFLKNEAYFQNSIYRDLMWGIIALREGDQAQAISHFSSALKKEPGETQIRFLVSMLYLQQRDHVSALQLFKDLSNADPSLGGPQYVQGIRAYYAGNRQQSLKYFEQALAVLNQEYIAFSDEPSGRFVIDQLRLALNSLCGEIYLEERKYKQALQYFSRAQKHDRKSIILDSRLKIAALLTQAEREPQNACLYAAVGYYYGLLNQDSRAAQYYERSLQLLPQSAEARLGLAIAYRHLRLYDKAYVNLTQALQYSKDKKIISAVYVELGNYYIATKKLSEAASVLAKAEVLDPENIAAQTDARYVQALLAYTSQPRSVSANLVLGQECLARQDYEQALARLRYVESMAPQNISGLLTLARTYYVLGDRQRARIYYERTLKIDPEETSVLFGYVDVLVADEDHTQAVSYIQNILKKDPNNVLVRNKLAAVYFAAGQNQNAIREWRFVLEHINNPEMTAMINNIIEVIG